MNEQLHALATLDDTTVSELLRRAVDGWDDRRLIGMDHKARSLSVRLSEKRRRKIAKLARRLKVSHAKAMIMMIEPLLESLPMPDAAPAPVNANVKPAAKAAPAKVKATAPAKPKAKAAPAKTKANAAKAKKAKAAPAKTKAKAKAAPAKTKAKAASAGRAGARTSRKR